MTITAAILPLGRTVFFGPEGPLAGGHVFYYIPATTTAKTTWQDPEEAIANVNPVPLDASGSALVYGSGQYRMVSFDSNGVQIDDSLTYGLPPGGGGASGGGFGAQTPIASATITDLGSVVSQNALITGVAPIVSFGPNGSLDSPIYYIEFDAGTELVYNPASMILPGKVTLTTDAGDGALVEYLGGSDWKVIVIFNSTTNGTGFGPQVALASAATTDLGATGANNILVTGNTTITSFGNSAVLTAPIYLLEFSGILTLTNSVNLKLPGGQNIKTSAGDTAEVEFKGAGVWQVRVYTQSNGQALSMAGQTAALASAATTDIGATGSNNVGIGGNAVITSLGASASLANPIYLVSISNFPTLTHNAVSLILPGGSDIACNPGDFGIFKYLGGGNWRCLSYNGNTPILLANASMSAAEFDIDFSPAFQVYEIVIDGLQPTNSGTSFTAVFRVAAADVAAGYQWTELISDSNAASTHAQDDSAASFVLGLAAGWTSADPQGAIRMMLFTDLGGSFTTRAIYDVCHLSNAGFAVNARGVAINAGPGGQVSGLGFAFSAGAIDRGRIRVYGYP